MIGPVAPWRYAHVGDYLQFMRTCLRFAKEHPGKSIQARYGEFWTAEEIPHRIRQALHIRINCKVDPTWDSTRKFSSDYQRAMCNDARAINAIRTQRLRVYATQITTDDWRRRFAPLFASYED